MNSAVSIAGYTIVAAVVLQTIVALLGSLRRRYRESRTAKLAEQLLIERVDAARLQTREQSEIGQSWSGLRKFEVVRRVCEGPATYSYWLEPHDNKPLPRYRPGQYLTFHLHVQNHEQPVIRCYSLSDSYDPQAYRVTVKQAQPPSDKPEAPRGVASSYFCEQVDIGTLLDVEAPRGHFTLDVADDRPVALVAGGIGITPLLAMLNAVVASGASREVHVFFSVRNETEFLFKDHLEEMSRNHFNIQLHVWLTAAEPRESTANLAAGMRQTIMHQGTNPLLVRLPQGPELLISQQEVVLGRSPECDVCVSESTVSGRHARLFKQNDSWFLEDLGSTNGTRLGDEPVSGPVEVVDHDVLHFSRASYRFVIPEPSVHSLASSDVSPAAMHNGRLTPDRLLQQLSSSNYLFYMCGPGGMMTDIGDGLEQAGVPAEHIFYEAFGPASRARRARNKGADCQVTFGRSGVTQAWDAEAGNLLEFATSAGVNIASGCRAGNCGVCLTAIRRGDVEYIGDVGAPVEPGSCLTCVAVPKEDLELDA